ncbi:DM13 domain-containing protein [Algihabitans albus]|uniref:DM13 domain-containing protein n=1 Tax=Algihabitans albus TaxID=2164067 RepID=UPI000E5D7439|nr:DM13 domain-containing protein [Algihabitans albus]
MFRFLKIAVPVFLIGFLVGNAFWYLASPLWIDREVSEVLPEELAVTLLREGHFRDADSAHKGQGRAELLQTRGGALLLRLSEFEVTNGPDLEVWLVKASDPASSAEVTASEWLSLGPLKGNIGDQIYQVPEGTPIGDYGSVVIWCEQFSVLFSPASLVASR